MPTRGVRLHYIMNHNKQHVQPTNKGKKNKKGRKNNRPSPDRLARLPVVRVKDIMPPRIMTKLKYLVARNLQNAAGLTASIQLNANGVYDVDPSLGSTAVPGFVEFVAFYRRFRVLRVKSVCTFINNEGFPLVINLGFEPAFFAANAKLQTYYEMHGQRTQLIPRTQTARGVTLSMTRDALSVVGDPICQTELNYSGTSGANPTALWYTSISCSSTNVGLPLTANGVTIRWQVEFDVEFFELQNLLS